MQEVLALITGPTGVGKTTVIETLVHNYQVHVVPVLTSRQERSGREVTRRCIPRATLKAKEADPDWMVFKYLSHGYALDRALAERRASANTLSVCDYPGDYEIDWIDTHNVILIFLMPPSEEQLRSRLEKAGRPERTQDSIANLREIQSRRRETVQNSIREIYVTNHDIDQTARSIIQIYTDHQADNV